jgi:hypothetical protein
LRFQKRLQRALTPGFPSVITVIINAAIVDEDPNTKRSIPEAFPKFSPIPTGNFRMPKIKSASRNQINPKAIRKKNTKFRDSNAFALYPTV